MALSIGPGFQEWIDSNQATPLSNEMYFSAEMSLIQVQVAGSDGSPVVGMLWYNKLTNTVSFDPFGVAA